MSLGVFVVGARSFYCLFEVVAVAFVVVLFLIHTIRSVFNNKIVGADGNIVDGLCNGNAFANTKNKLRIEILRKKLKLRKTNLKMEMGLPSTFVNFLKHSGATSSPGTQAQAT